MKKTLRIFFLKSGEKTLINYLHMASFLYASPWKMRFFLCSLEVDKEMWLKVIERRIIWVTYKKTYGKSINIFVFEFFAFIKELYDPFVNSGFIIPKTQKKIFGLVKKTEFSVFFLY